LKAPLENVFITMVCRAGIDLSYWTNQVDMSKKKLAFNATTLSAMPNKIAVAWSGGADSTALLLGLADLGFEVQAWHIDHGWSETSYQTMLTLADRAKEWGISFQSKSIDKPGKNIEALARKGRYTAFAELAQQSGYFHLALGHHADDQAETVCMRLLQGAGVAGCQGMRPYRQQAKLHIFRPLLDVSRIDIERFLLVNEIIWLDDPSNQDTQLWRNKIRKSLFPEMNTRGVNPQQLFLRWQKQALKVQQKITVEAQLIAVSKQQEHQILFCDVNWEQWQAQSQPVRVFVLQKMIGQLFDDGTVFGRRHILAIEQWRQHGGHGWLNLSGCCLYRRDQGLQLCQGKASLRHHPKNHLIQK